MIELLAIALIFIFAAIGMISGRIGVNGLAIFAITAVMVLVQNAVVIITAVLAMFLIALISFVKSREAV